VVLSLKEINMTQTTKFMTAAALCTLGSVAFAQSAGTWTARVGLTNITPQVSSGDMTAPSFPNTKSDVGGDTQLSGGITYMYTDNIAIDIPVALPFNHKLKGAGALAGAGQIGAVKALPFTVFGQYRFNAASAVFRPYVGLGLTYAYFFDESGSSALTAMTNPGGSATRLSVQSKFALTPQLGFTYVLNDKWTLDGSFSQTLLKTRTTFSTGQTLDATLNPNTISLGIGTKF
jgi:outer membrane protein